MKDPLVSRKGAFVSSTIGVLEVMVASALILCSFILWGTYCDSKLECAEGISNGIGFWLGFPLLISGLLGIVVLVSRKKEVSYAFAATNFILLGLSVAHIVLASMNTNNFWKGMYDAYLNEICVDSSSESFFSCSCPINYSVKQVSVLCELVPMGHYLSWVMFGLSVVAGILSLIGAFVGIVNSLFVGANV